MPIKLVVLYTQPKDPAAFDKHYQAVHAPLVDKLPGLQRWESAQFLAAVDGGEQTYHRIVELYFEDQAGLAAALGSPQGQAAAADYQKIAPAGSRMLVAVIPD